MDKSMALMMISMMFTMIITTGMAVFSAYIIVQVFKKMVLRRNITKAAILVQQGYNIVSNRDHTFLLKKESELVFLGFFETRPKRKD